MAVIVARHIETVHDMFVFKEKETEPFYSWFISDGSKKLKPITFSNSKWMSPNFDSPWDHLPSGLLWSNIASMGAIHSTNIQTGPTGKRGPPQKVDLFFRNFSGWTEPIH